MLGGTALVVAGLAWVLRKLIDQFFNNKIEKFKYELEKENTKFRITYERLHVERAEIIKETYKKIVLTFDLFRSYVNPLQLVGEKPEIEKKKEAGLAYNEFYKFYDENRIFFDESLAAKIDKLRETLWDAWIKFQLSRDLREGSHRGGHDEWMQAWTKVDNEVPLIRKEIEAEFRKIIGIE